MSSEYNKDKLDEFCEVILANENDDDLIYMPTTAYNQFSYLIVQYLELRKMDKSKCYHYNNPNDVSIKEFGFVFEEYNYQYVHNCDTVRCNNKAIILENNESYKYLKNDVDSKLYKKILFMVRLNSSFRTGTFDDFELIMKFLSRFCFYNLRYCNEKNFLFNNILLAKLLKVDSSYIQIYNGLIDEKFEEHFLECRKVISDIIKSDYNSNHAEFLSIPIDYLKKNDDSEQISDFIVLIILTYNSFDSKAKEAVLKVLNKL